MEFKGSVRVIRIKTFEVQPYEDGIIRIKKNKSSGVY